MSLPRGRPAQPSGEEFDSMVNSLPFSERLAILHKAVEIMGENIEIIKLESLPDRFLALERRVLIIHELVNAQPAEERRPNQFGGHTFTPMVPRSAMLSLSQGSLRRRRRYVSVDNRLSNLYCIIIDLQDNIDAIIVDVLPDRLEDLERNLICIEAALSEAGPTSVNIDNPASTNQQPSDNVPLPPGRPDRPSQEDFDSMVQSLPVSQQLEILQEVVEIMSRDIDIIQLEFLPTRFLELERLVRIIHEIVDVEPAEERPPHVYGGRIFSSTAPRSAMLSLSQRGQRHLSIDYRMRCLYRIITNLQVNIETIGTSGLPDRFADLERSLIRIEAALSCPAQAEPSSGNTENHGSPYQQSPVTRMDHRIFQALTASDQTLITRGNISATLVAHLPPSPPSQPSQLSPVSATPSVLTGPNLPPPPSSQRQASSVHQPLLSLDREALTAAERKIAKSTSDLKLTLAATILLQCRLLPTNTLLNHTHQ
ncbi:hypothetical protein MJO28_016838 [Puccinia striiformis f. sp. tritici]|nr:hypothetical protein MJO28_016838 [Puccinia striiformis f. sp. tritici]KAI7966403.1 hypothetical protein MJO29_002151 [Puccinia striiformis f. sp. tritici]